MTAVRMSRQQAQRLSMIDQALDTLRGGFISDRGTLITPINTSAGAGGSGASVSGHSVGKSSVHSAATVTRGVTRQDIVVALAKAKQQIQPEALESRDRIAALVADLRKDTPMLSLPGASAPSAAPPTPILHSR